MKKCSNCGDEFNPPRPDAKWCPRCRSGEGPRARRSPRLAGVTAPVYRERMYGLAPGTYEDLFEAQHGRCAICGRQPEGRNLSVDHNHTTGRVRGLLCGPCNRGLGFFADDPERLRAAILYLVDPPLHRLARALLAKPV